MKMIKRRNTRKKRVKMIKETPKLKPLIPDEIFEKLTVPNTIHRNRRRNVLSQVRKPEDRQAQAAGKMFRPSLLLLAASPL